MRDAVFAVRNIQTTWFLGPLTEGQKVPKSRLLGDGVRPEWPFPQLRVFGRTPAGQSACVDVAGVLPYVLVPSPLPDPHPQWLAQLASALERGLQPLQSLPQHHSSPPIVFDIRTSHYTYQFLCQF